MGIPIADAVVFVTGDRARSFTAALVDAADGTTPVDLTGNTVRLLIVSALDETTVVDAAATIDSATLGEVSYEWTAADWTAIIAALGGAGMGGDMWAWWVRTDGSGRTEHFPGQRERLRVSFVPVP